MSEVYEYISPGNYRRAMNFEDMLDSLPESYRESPQDFLCDFLHWVHQHGDADFIAVLRMGLTHFIAEATTDEDEEAPYTGPYAIDEQDRQILNKAHSALYLQRGG